MLRESSIRKHSDYKTIPIEFISQENEDILNYLNISFFLELNKIHFMND